MSILRKELFDVLINANHFNPENDEVQLTIHPSEYASKLQLLNVEDRDTIENHLKNLGYEIEGSYGEGGSLGSPTDDDSIQDVITRFNIVDNSVNPPQLVSTDSTDDDSSFFEMLMNNGNFSADPDNTTLQYLARYEYGYDMFGYVVKQLISGTRGIIELKAGINNDIVFYNIDPTSIADIFSNEIANVEGPYGGLGGNLKYIQTVAEPYTRYALITTPQAAGGNQEFNTNYGFAASNLGGNSTYETNNTIHRNQKYTIRVDSDTTIDYRAFQSRTNGVLDNPVTVNLRQKGNPIHGTDLELFHDRSDYTDGIKSLNLDEWKDIGEPSTNLVRYNWDSIKYYLQFLTHNQSPAVKIQEFLSNMYQGNITDGGDGPKIRFLTTSAGGAYYNEVKEAGTVQPNPDERDLYLFYKLLCDTQQLQIPGAIGGGGPGGIDETFEFKNYWDILNLGIALPPSYGGKQYAETITATDQFFIDNPRVTFGHGLARERVITGTQLILAQPKFIGAGASFDMESYWDEKDGAPLIIQSNGDVSANNPEGGTYNAAQLGLSTMGGYSGNIGPYENIRLSVPFVFSRNNRELEPGTNIRYNPVIGSPSQGFPDIASLGYDMPEFKLYTNFKKLGGILESTTGLSTWHRPDEHIQQDDNNDRPAGFAGITESPHLFVYREMLNKYEQSDSSGLWQYDYGYTNLYQYGTYTDLFNDGEDENGNDDNTPIGLYHRLIEASGEILPPSSIGAPLLDRDVVNLGFNASGWSYNSPFNGIAPRAVFDRSAASIYNTGIYTGDPAQDNNATLAGRFLVREVPNTNGYEDRDVALSVLLFDFVYRYIREPGNIQVQYAGLSISDALQGYNNTIKFMANPTPGTVFVQFPNSTIEDIEIPLTVNNTTSENITEKVIKSSNVAKDFSQNLFGGSFNYKLSTTLDDENSDDRDSPFYNRIIPNSLNDLYSHAIDSSCLSFPYQTGHAENGGQLVKTIRTYATHDKGRIYTDENYLEHLATSMGSLLIGNHASYNPHRANPLSNDLVAGGYRGNQDKTVDINLFKGEDKDERKLVQHKFRMRNISNAPQQGDIAPAISNANFHPLDHRSAYAAMFNTDVIPVMGDTYTFSCKVRVSEGFRVTMGVRKYNIDPDNAQLTLLEKIKQSSGSLEDWFSQDEAGPGDNGGYDHYSDDTRINYNTSIMNQVKKVGMDYGIDTIPNELQPIEYAMNRKLLDNMSDAGPNNTIDNIIGYTFSDYDDVIQNNIQDSFLVHTTSPIGSLPLDYNPQAGKRSGLVHPLYVTFQQSDKAFVRKVGTPRAPIGLLSGNPPYHINENVLEYVMDQDNHSYQAGGLQILFYIHFDTEWYKQNISPSDTNLYEYIRSRRLEFEIIEPKLSGQDEYKEGPYINQPRIGPTIWTDSTAFNPNKGGYIPQESVYADYGVRYRLYIRNDPIVSGVVLGKTGFYGDMNRGVNSTNPIGDYLQNIKELQNTGLTHTYDDNGDYIIQLIADDTYGNRHSIENPVVVSNIIKAVRSIDIVITGSNHDVGYVPYKGLDIPYSIPVSSSEFYELDHDVDKRETLGVFSFDDDQSNLFQAVDNAPWIYNPLYSNAVFNTTTDDNGNTVPDETNPKQDIYIDNNTNTIRFVPRWLPECDVRPFENLQKGTLDGTLFRYNDPDIDPDIVDITTAPTTVNFFFYRRREFVDFSPNSTDPQKQIFDDSIIESFNGSQSLWNTRSDVKGSSSDPNAPGLSNIINPFARKTTSRYVDATGGSEEYWYFAASGSGGYFGPSGSNHMAFPDELDLTEEEEPNWETFISNVDWGDGTVSERERFRNKPKKLGAETIISHTYTKPGVHKVTGCMWDMRMNSNDETGVYTDIRNVRTFILKFHLNGNPNNDSSLLLNDVPTVVVSGISNASIYNKSLEAFIGYVPPTETQEASFLPYPFKYHYDKVSSAAAAATVDEKYINDELLIPYSSERYSIRTVTNIGTSAEPILSASYSGEKIMKGLFKNFGSLGDYVGDTDIAQTRIFTHPYRIVDHLGFPNNDVTIEEASTPDNKKYWNNIIPKDYLFTNRIGVSSTTVADKLVINIDTSSNQQWENNYMYPALPLLNQFGQFDEALGLPEDSVLYGQKTTWEGDDNISYVTKEVVNDNQLRLDIQLHEIDDNKLLDTAGEGITIRPISDYKIGVDLKTLEIEFNEPLYGTSTDNDENAY